jgi:hypothetical protein
MALFKCEKEIRQEIPNKYEQDRQEFCDIKILVFFLVKKIKESGI